MKRIFVVLMDIFLLIVKWSTAHGFIVLSVIMNLIRF